MARAVLREWHDMATNSSSRGRRAAVARHRCAPLRRMFRAAWRGSSGDEYTLADGVLSVETYRKNYHDYPVSTEYPSLSLANLGDTFNVLESLFPLTRGRFRPQPGPRAQPHEERRSSLVRSGQRRDIEDS